MSTMTAGRTSRKTTSRRTTPGKKAGRGSPSSSSGDAAGAVLSAVNDAVGNGLTESLNAVKARIGDQITGKGEKYLKEASEQISQATAKVVKWGKQHPVKSAAAAAALIAVSAFLYSTLGKTAGAGKGK